MHAIKNLRTQHGLSQAQLAAICGVHQTAVSQWEQGRTTPDTNSLRLLAEYFGVTMETVLGLEGNKERHLVPVLGYVRAGIPVEAVQEVLDYEEITPEMAGAGEHFALSIQGDSMAPRFLPGDVVIVRRQEDVDSGDVAVVLVNGMDATVKKVIKNGNSIVLMPLNNAYEPTAFTREEVAAVPVTIVGKVVELRGKY